MGLVGAGWTPCLIVTAHKTEVSGTAGKVCRTTRVLAARAEVACIALTRWIFQSVGVTVVASGAGEAICDVGATCKIYKERNVGIKELAFSCVALMVVTHTLHLSLKLGKTMSTSSFVFKSSFNSFYPRYRYIRPSHHGCCQPGTDISVQS